MTVPFSLLPVDQGGRYDTTKYPSGAGRWSDWMWPDPLLTTLTSSGVLQIRNRMTGLSTPIAFGSYGGGSSVAIVIANTGQGTIMGGPCIQLVAGASDGQGQIARMTLPLVWMNTNKAATKVLASNNDLGVTRVYANIAYNAFGGGGVMDSGLQVTNNGGLLVANGQSGVGFVRSANGVIKLSVIPVTLGPATVFQLTSAASFNDQLVHSYELIFISATPTTQAMIIASIDGVILKTIVNDGVQAFPVFSGTQLGFTVQCVYGAQNSAMYVTANGGLRIISGPTLASCY